MIHSLFCFNTSSHYLPGKGEVPKASKWKITPKLNISHMGSYLVYLSFKLDI
jgi:hypothetical protein